MTSTDLELVPYSDSCPDPTPLCLLSSLLPSTPAYSYSMSQHRVKPIPMTSHHTRCMLHMYPVTSAYGSTTSINNTNADVEARTRTRTRTQSHWHHFPQSALLIGVPQL